MTCEQCRDNYTEFIEGSLAPEQHGAMEAHLASCPACAADLEAFRAAVSALRALPKLPPPPGLLSDIGAALDEAAPPRPAPRAKARSSWQVAGTVAVAACLLMGFTFLFRNGLGVPKGQPSADSVLVEREDAPTMAQVPKAQETASARPPVGPPMGPGTAPEAAAPGHGEGLADAAPAPGGPGGGLDSEVGATSDAEARPAPTAPGAAAVKRSGGPGRDRPAPRRMKPRAATPGASATAARSAAATEDESASSSTSRAVGGTVVMEGAKVAAARGPAAPSPAAQAPPMRVAVADPDRSAAANTVVPEAVEPPTYSASPVAKAAAPGGRARTTGTPATDRAKAAPRTGLGMAAAPPPAAEARAGAPVVEMVFVPPAQRTVGVPCVGSVVVRPGQSIDAATLYARGEEGLRVTNTSADGTLFKGALPPARTTFAVGMLAEEPGTHELSFRLQSASAEAEADLKASIPGFEPRGQLGPAEALDGDRAPTVTFVFRQRDIAEALRAVAQRGKVRLELGPDVSGEKVNVELRDVPVEAALRILCEAGGCTLHGGGGDYRITRP